MEKEIPPKDKKKKKGLSFKGKAILLFLGIFLLFMTPLPGFLISLTPPNFVRDIMSDFYQDITLDQSGKLLDKPLKYDENAPYPVLGRESGVCFKFHSTKENENKNNIDAYRIKNALRGKPITEIILVDIEKKQYTPAEVTVSEGAETSKNNTIREFTAICQKIGRSETYTPKDIKAIYIRPLEGFRPSEVVWVTQKDW